MAPKNEGLRVLAACAFYRDDHPDGISAGIGFEGDDGLDFCRELERKMPKYDRSARARVLAELTRLAPKRLELSSQEMAHVIACIYWLQLRDHLRADEYNGPIFDCMYRGTLVRCEHNPIVIDLDRAIVSPNAVDVTDIIRASTSPLLDRGAVEAIRVATDHARRAR